MSIVGGDLGNDDEFRSRFRNGDIKDFGYTVVEAKDHQVSQEKGQLCP